MIIATWLLLTAGFILITIFLYKRYKKHKNAPPGPWNLPIFGYLPWLDPKAPYLTLTKLSQKYGPIYGLYLGTIYTVVISDVNLLKKIFFKEAGSGRAPLYVLENLTKGKGIAFTEGDLWKHQRKLIHNFLKKVGASKTSPNRNKLEADIKKNILDFVQLIKSKGDPAVLAPEDIVFQTVGSLISLITLGKSWSRNDETWKYLLSAFEETSKLAGIAAPANFLPFLNVFPKYKKVLLFFNNAKARVHAIFKNIINEKSWTPDDKFAYNLIQAFMAERSKHEGTADAGKFYDEEQLHSLMADIFGAGVETTVGTIMWFLLYTAVYQKVQSKVRRELKEILDGKLPTLDDLSKLPYTEATIAEVLRIRTTSPLGIPHGVLDNIEVNDFTIAKGTMILPCLWALHMDPKVWSDPDNFKPERFLDTKGKFCQPESFIPFQIGRRVCPGMELAKMQIFLFVTIILQHFRIECENPGKIDLTGVLGVTLRPKTHKLIFSVAKKDNIKK